jgi:hypothetical protein
MKVLRFAVIAVGFAGVALVVSCGPKAPQTSDTDKQDQDRQAEEHEAQVQRESHEREAALDERERLLTERENQLTVATTPAPTPQQAEAPQPGSPVQVPAGATPAPADSTDASYQAFYDALSPYGAWVTMPGYGYVWQPAATVQDAAWRPYTVGHWAFTDQGWTWMSEEPFGWVTYHYGRWMRTRGLNWVWVPGDQWAPAWVSWRYGNDFVGWAPLPPEARFDGATGIQQWADDQYNLGASDYTFVPASDFGDDSMADNAVPVDQNGPIYDDSNNMTNIYYDTGAYAIVCYGPDYDFMLSKSHRRLPPILRIHRGGFRAGGNNGALILGGTLDVAAPRIVASRVPVAPKEIRGRVADTRLIVPVTAPQPPHGTVTEYRTPQAGNGVPAAGMKIPSQMKPAPIQQSAPGGGALTNQPNPGGMHVPSRMKPVAIQESTPGAVDTTNRAGPNGMRIPSQMNPVPISPDVQAQKARDLQKIEQEEVAAKQQQEEEAARATAEQEATRLHAEESARAQRAAERAAADAQAAKATREQAARDQVVHQAQPASVPGSVPASSQGTGQQGRGQL